MNITAINAQHLPHVWPAIMQYIQEPLEYESGGLTPEKIYSRIEGGTFVLLVAWEGNRVLAAQTCEVISDPAGRVMNLPTTGGVELEKWQDAMADAIERLATEQGCISVRTRGRPGWLRQLKRNGFKPLYFIAEKRINHVGL